MRVAIVCALSVLVAGCDRQQEDPVKSSELMAVQHVSVSIDKPPREVYRFASNPRNLQRWAKGLASSPAEVEGDELLVQSPMGQVTVKFTPRNEHGILDHEVTLPSGETVLNPLRVMPNARGSEVVFSVFRRPETTDAQFHADLQAVARDLHTLKALVEGE